MPTLSFVHTTTLAAGLAVALLAGGPGAAEEPNPCNPCGAKNPCNPCAAKPANPCGAENACNPCAGVEANPCAADNPCNPCGAEGANPCSEKTANPCNPCVPKQTNPCGAEMNPCNPCGATNPCNPCGAASRVDPAKFTRPAGLTLESDGDQLLAEGEKLWRDPSLSTNGAACATCHTDYGQFLASFAEPYPHGVAMVKAMSGVDGVDAAEMVQFCMLQPMQAEPLPWSSTQLAALAAYVEHVQSGFDPDARGMKSANPCNPCGGGNPCGAGNPCSP